MQPFGGRFEMDGTKGSATLLTMGLPSDQTRRCRASSNLARHHNGGYKQSGRATEMGEELMERCTETKAVGLGFGGRPPGRPQRTRSSSGREFAARTRIEEI
jgi:hypothetical protein